MTKWASVMYSGVVYMSGSGTITHCIPSIINNEKIILYGFFPSFLTVTKYCSMYSIHSLPAARAAFTPLGLSSNTMHFLGSFAGGSNLFAQTRLMSGKGLPWMTSGSECPVTMWWKSWNNSWWFLVFNSKYSLELLVAKAIGTWHWCRCLISLSTPLSNFAWKQKYHSSEIRVLCLLNWPSEMLQNLSDLFVYLGIQKSFFFHFWFHANYFFRHRPGHSLGKKIK